MVTLFCRRTELNSGGLEENRDQQYSQERLTTENRPGCTGT